MKPVSCPTTLTHLGVVLGLVGRLDPDRGGAMARSVLLPALAKLRQGFEDPAHPYCSVLDGMQDFLADHHGAAEQRTGVTPAARNAPSGGAPPSKRSRFQ